MDSFIFTCGDINGIGPEIAIKALNYISSKRKNNRFILIIPGNVFENTIKLVKPLFKYRPINENEIERFPYERILILKTKSFTQKTGKPTVASGNAAYLALKTSFKLLHNSLADAVITAPVSKTALKLAGVNYPGQTEMFADWCGVKNFVMTFLSRQLRVGLYSIHIPLKEVSKSLNLSEFMAKIDVSITMLKKDLGIPKPRIAVLGLNPHAGEKGIIGSEEKNIIEPAIKSEKYRGIAAGPFSPDAFFATRRFNDFDLIFGLYHDQVLIPFKYINAGKGVNYSAGLPIIRTSPDHGVAYDIAGKGIADESSMIEAFRYAVLILKNRKNNLQSKISNAEKRKIKVL
jgi:4-hydroxythreonine-4-phosphate dehydrogenase